MADAPSKSRRWTVLASGLLCGVLALVVLFTTRGAFFSPLAVVVVAAIGLAAVLLQRRLYTRGEEEQARGPVWLNVVGVGFALAAVFADILHLGAQVAEIMALGAVGSFAVSGAIVLHAFRKRRAESK